MLARPAVRALLAPGFDAADWMESLELAAADVVAPSSGLRLVRADPDDDPYLWTAYVGSATHLVTWDAEVLALKHHRDTQVVTPGALLGALREHGSFSAEAGARARGLKGTLSATEADALRASVRRLRGMLRT